MARAFRGLEAVPWDGRWAMPEVGIVEVAAF
jgi:hypothetical protein